MYTMPTTTELQDVIENARNGVRDTAAMQKACERMDESRQLLRESLGHDVDIAVPTIRELRDGE